MLRGIPEKVSLLIGDFRQIVTLTEVIEHQMEKRIVARHGLVKIDSILKRLPELKNIVRRTRANVTQLELMVDRLGNDYNNSVMVTVRDALAVHSLKLSLPMIVEAWSIMNKTIFDVLLSDMNDIDAELSRLFPSYTPARTPVNDNRWRAVWRTRLGSPDRPRYASIYPGLATAGVVSIVPGGHPAQDATIRAVSTATFIRQARLLCMIPGKDDDLDRIFAEMMLNDYISLLDQLFVSGMQNEHGEVDTSLVQRWNTDRWKGKKDLIRLSRDPHRNLALWRQKRNKVSAHLDGQIALSEIPIAAWPFYLAELMDESLRVIEAFRSAANRDIRGKAIFMPPTEFPSEVVGLAAQNGRHWED